MSQDSSLVGAFDLNSQTGVMSILASIRGSKLSAVDKNELRDLVFLYTNGGGDASVRIALEQKLATHQIVPVQVQQVVSSGPALSFGSYRPTPTFRKAPQVATLSVPVSTPVVSPSTKPVTNVVSAVPVVPISTPPVAPVSIPVVEIPKVAPVVPIQAPAPEPSPIPVPGVVSNDPVVLPTTVIPGEANYIERIRQIKTAVNSKVGNPVNLVDINNEVGREYMNALLEAMKKLSSGAVSEMEPAMKRLEAAYVAVEAAIVGHNKTTLPTPVAPIAVMSPVPPVETTMPVSIAEALPPIQDLPQRPLPPVPEPEVFVPRAPAVPEVQEAMVPEPMLTVVESVAEVKTPELEPQPTTFALADRKKILTPQDLPEASAVSTGVSGDPLSTKEVDDGLNQLLSDWTLFKKSGLFGTGPKGREHPLFKKIAGLQVPLLLAGRFDGATQEIRQSITDYMNGWRYEQGIIYQPGETFEKYLRRVIKHIIDLQKKHKQP